MDAARFLLPADVAVFVDCESRDDDHALRLANRAGRFDNPRCIDVGQRDALGNGLRVKDAVLLTRLPRLLDAHERPVLPPHHPPPLAVDHANPRVTMTGAYEPTTSSCPSREQTTPG